MKKKIIKQASEHKASISSLKSLQEKEQKEKENLSKKVTSLNKEVKTYTEV